MRWGKTDAWSQEQKPGEMQTTKQENTEYLVIFPSDTFTKQYFYSLYSKYAADDTYVLSSRIRKENYHM